MKLKIFIILLFFAVTACKQEPKIADSDWQKISERVQTKENNGNFSLSSGKFSYQWSDSVLPFKKIVLLNASLVGYFTELGIEDRIVGISSPEYIYSEKVRKLIDDGTIANVGNEQKFMLEKILALKPDAVITNHITTFENTYQLLEKNGIEVIFLDEYLEQNPLEKTGYLTVFGKLFGVEQQAEERFKEIEKRYDSLKVLAAKESGEIVVFANEMYGNQWFMPGGKTQFAQFIRDANAQYILKENSDNKSIPTSFEEVLAKTENAEFWMNAGNHQSKKSLLAINPNYEKLNAFINGKIYVLTGREKGRSNDFFESGVVRSDLVLQDYIAIFHPHLLPGYQLTYMKELK